MATKAQVQQKLAELGVNREATDEDVANVNKHGMSLLDRQFGGGSGVPTNADESVSPAQAGQSAYQDALPEDRQLSVDELRIEEQKAINRETAIGSEANRVNEFIQQSLKAAQAAGPIDKEIKKRREEIGSISVADYEGMTSQDMLAAMNRDMARISSEISYFQDQRNTLVAQADEITANVASIMNAELESAGLRVVRIQDLLNRGIQEQQFAQQLARSGSRGRAKEEKPEDRFEAAALFAINDMEAGRSTWGEVWNELKAYFPEKSNEEIDQALGGGMVQMSTPSGVPEYWGRAAQYGTLPDPLERDLYEFEQREAIKAKYNTGGSSFDAYIQQLEAAAAAE